MADEGVQYRFLSVVGEGGFGKVYRARLETGEGFNKEVAIKVLSDPSPPKTLLQRFRDEAKILGLMRDRAIVGADPPIKIGDRWAVVMEFVDGVSCGVLVNKGPFPLGVAVEVVGEVARALHNAYHMVGPEGEPLHLLHRDIKPDNIQITPSGDIRILDFGIAKANFAAREFKTRHSLGGTPGYIAPERLMRIEVPEGDVYSLGVVLHELITGKRPMFPPTLNFDLNADTVPNAAHPAGMPALDVEELEIDDELRNQPFATEVLTLAAWMRGDGPEDRPSARQVEELCRDLRAKLPRPYLREWAEEHVPSRVELDDDDMVGNVLTTATHILSDPSAAPTVKLPDDGLSLRGPASISSPPTLPPQRSNREVALGAFLGGGAALIFASVVVVAVLVGVVVVLSVNRPEPVPLPEQPVEVLPTPEAPEQPDEQPVPDEPETPTQPPPAPPPATPTPPPSTPTHPPSPPTKVITLPVTPVAPPPEPEPVLPPERAPPTGLVVVRTVPSGATVRLKGQTLERTGRGYAIPVGRHVLTVSSPSGETTRIPVHVKLNETVEICYSFDTNSACGR